MLKRTFTYPGSDLDRGQSLVAALGTFWSRIYAAQDQLQSYTTSAAVLVAQNYRNILETVWSLSRFDVPLFHTQYWVPITIRKSELSPAKVVNNFFDVDRGRFDLNNNLFDGIANKDLFYFSAPEKLAGVTQIFNRIIHPTVALIENVDYVLDENSKALAFVSNPFENPGFLKRATVTDSEPDEEIVLWGFNGSFDYENVFNQFAYAVGLRLKTSHGFKDLTNAIIDGLISGGATCADLDLALSAICGIPLTVEKEETVEVIDYDTHGVFIATDKHLYRFGRRAEPVVTVGQKVRAGSQLIRGFEIDEFFVGTTYDPFLRDSDSACCATPTNILATNLFNDILTESDEALLVDAAGENCTPKKALAALALDSGFLSACFYGDLVFENKNVPLIVDTDHETGYTYVSFKVAGMPQDVKQFFDEIHRRGVDAAEHAAGCAADPKIKGTAVAWPPVAAPQIGDIWVLNTPVPLGTPAGWNPGSAVKWTGAEWVNLGAAETLAPKDPRRQPRPGRYTLAQLLDRRKNPISEPGPQHLPAVINPLRFIVENTLRNNVFVVKLSVSALGQNRLGLYNVRHLRNLLPPGVAMLLIFELEAPLNIIDGSEQVNENTQFFVGLEPATDTADDTLVQDLGVTVRLLSGTCQ